ncbi:hypothetical protein EPO34_03585 [Patescibacteria group bacterium]|nr:MAG: hypothetical protein EPO34_03585 [Patescibacteria group bacterium]
MALDAVKNFAKGAVSQGYDSLATSIVLASGDGARFPDPSSDGEFNVVWWNSTDYGDPSDDPNREIVRVTARTTDTLTITRAQESTSAANHNTAGKTYKVALAMSAKMIADLIAELNLRFKQGGNAFGAAAVLGTTDDQVVQIQHNGSIRLELNASGLNLYAPRTIYTAGGDIWFGATTAHNIKFNTNNSERARIDSAGDVSIGTTSTGVRLRVVDNDGGGVRGTYTTTIMQIHGKDADANHLLIDAANNNPFILFRHSTGTFASPAATAGNNFISGFDSYAHDGSAFQWGARFFVAASSGVAWSASNRGTELWCYLCNVNTTSPGVRLVIKGNGELTSTTGTTIAEGSGGQINSVSTKNAMSGVGAIVNYAYAGIHNANTNGAGAGIALTVTTAFTTNIAASLIGYRVGSNAQGRLLIYTKQSTTGGAAPNLALVIDENQKVLISGTNGTASARLHIQEPTLGSEAHRIETVATNDDVAEKVYQGRAATTDATATTILTLATITDSVKMIEIKVAARRTGGTGGTAGDGAGYARVATFKNIAGTVSQIGSTQDNATHESQAVWDVSFSISGTNVLVQVTGAADNNITWHATARVYELST